MAYHLPFKGDTFRPLNDVIPGNETDPNPVEFDIVPAEGPDLARLKSIIFADLGLIQDGNWDPSTQESVIRAFETGAPVFIRTVEAIRGLTIPKRLARKVGIVPPLADGQVDPDPQEPVPVLNGLAFTKVCGYMAALALHVAFKITSLSASLEIDPRFFGQPSGSPGPAKPRRTRGSAKRARNTSAGKGTVA
jgi:hypothetical protein